MSLIRHADVVKSTIVAPRFGNGPVGRHARIASRLRDAGEVAVSLLARAVEAVAEARMHRLAIEAELYRERYLHTSKNDDDLPVVRRGQSPGLVGSTPMPTSIPGNAHSRDDSASGNEPPRQSLGSIALALAIFTVLVGTAIVLRLVIWLPLSH